MLKFCLSIFLFVSGSLSAPAGVKDKFVFEYYKNTPSLDSEAVIDLMADAQPGLSFPLNHGVPDTGFNCTNVDGPGYYADPAEPSLCQAFYRCDVSGEQTGFLCSNSTLFNQITLTCDYYYNVDCGNATQFYNYGNSRMYQGERPLFDTPPKDYVSPLSGFYPGELEGSARARPEQRLVQKIVVPENNGQTEVQPKEIVVPAQTQATIPEAVTTEKPTTEAATNEEATTIAEKTTTEIAATSEETRGEKSVATTAAVLETTAEEEETSTVALSRNLTLVSGH